MTKFDFIETDKRIMEQKIKKHELSPQELQKLLKSLPDDASLADELDVHKESESV